MAQTQASSSAPIILGIDFGRPSVYALRRGAEIFRRSPASSLELIHVLEGAPESENDELGLSPTARRLRDFVHLHLADPSAIAGRPVGLHVRAGHPAQSIMRFAVEIDAQLVVVGSHGREGIVKRILGSTSEKILAACPVPVVLATGDASSEPPVIEPLCAACASARGSSGGRTWWCARHSEHHLRAHAFSYRQAWPYELHDSDIVPTGTSSPGV